MTGNRPFRTKETPMLIASAIAVSIILGSAARGWAKIERAKHGNR